MAKTTDKSIPQSEDRRRNSKPVKDPGAYVPPPELLLQAVTFNRNGAGGDTVQMSVSAFSKLLETALHSSFDEAQYLSDHEDIRRGIASRSIVSALKHYAAHGFFEKRQAPDLEVDSDWYIATYPDVARAIKAGQVRDAADHFKLFGYAEARVPNKAFAETIAEWHAVAKAPSTVAAKSNAMPSDATAQSAGRKGAKTK